MDLSRRNVFLLACCQALLLTNAVTLIAVGALAGYALATTRCSRRCPWRSTSWAAALATVPASFWMRRVGRRNGFLTGAALRARGLAGRHVRHGLLASLRCFARAPSCSASTTRSASTTASPPQTPRRPDFEGEGDLVRAGRRPRGRHRGPAGEQVHAHVRRHRVPRHATRRSSSSALVAMAILSCCASRSPQRRSRRRGAAPAARDRAPAYLHRRGGRGGAGLRHR